MNETFRNVSIFIIFIMSLFLWNAARAELVPYFKFDYGKSVLLVLWSTGVLVLFHVLYHYLSKTSEQVVYICMGLVVVGVGCLLHYNVIPSH